MKNETIYKLVWITESVGGIERGEKEFKTSEAAYAYAENILKQRELFATFVVKKLELTEINTYSLIPFLKNF